MPAIPALPQGYRHIRLDEIDSTNAEAMRRAATGEAGGLWITAASQTQGRGRQGREWLSMPGNLFASLLLRPQCDPQAALQLAFVAGIALHDAVSGLLTHEQTRLLQLKWPNDLLLQERKLAGVLIESASQGGQPAPVVVGTGINLVSAPEVALQPAISLAETSAEIDAGKMFTELATATARRLSQWHDGAGWAAIRKDWLDRGPRQGAPLQVREGNKRLQGAFAGLGDDGALLIDLGGGTRKSISAGDVFLL